MNTVFFNRFKRVIAFILLQIMVYTHVVFAENVLIVVDSAQHTNGNTPIVDETRNGVPIINISAPTITGTSANSFKDYSVGEEGVIVNNGLGQSATILGGDVYGNPNFKGQTAEIIVFDVTGKKQSELKGFTEIAGDRADFVLTNPNGIFINGAGFINTSRVTLSTGKSMWDGSTLRYGVSTGNIFVDSGGLWTLDTPYVDLLSQTVQFNGAVVGTGNSVLSVVSGLNTVTHGSLDILSNGGTGGRTAIDSSALGGMYHGKIRLISTDSGAGVHVEGDIITYADDLELSVNGDVSYGTLYSSKKIGIKSSGTVTQNTQAIANGDLSISAGNSLVLKGKGLYTAGTLSLSASQNMMLDGSEVRDSAFIQGQAVKLTAGQYLSANATIVVGDETALTAREMSLTNATFVGSKTMTMGAKTILTNNTQWLDFDTLSMSADGKIQHVGSVVSVNRMYETADTVLHSDSVMNAKRAEISASSLFFIGNNAVIQTNATDVQAETIVNNNGMLLSFDRLGLSGSTILNTNGGVFYAGNAIGITSNYLINNSESLIIAKKEASIFGQYIENNGGTLAVQDGSLSLSGKILVNDNGAIHASNALSVLFTKAIANGVNGLFNGNTTDFISPLLINKGQIFGEDHLVFSGGDLQNTQGGLMVGSTVSVNATGILLGDQSAVFANSLSIKSDTASLTNAAVISQGGVTANIGVLDSFGSLWKVGDRFEAQGQKWMLDSSTLILNGKGRIVLDELKDQNSVVIVSHDIQLNVTQLTQSSSTWNIQGMANFEIGNWQQNQSSVLFTKDASLHSGQWNSSAVSLMVSGNVDIQADTWSDSGSALTFAQDVTANISQWTRLNSDVTVGGHAAVFAKIG